MPLLACGLTQIISTGFSSTWVCPAFVDLSIVSLPATLKCKRDEAVPFPTTPATNHSGDDGDNTKDWIRGKEDLLPPIALLSLFASD